MSRIYGVKQDGKLIALVDAASPGAAIVHAAKPTFTAAVISAKDAMASGLKVVKAGDQTDGDHDK